MEFLFGAYFFEYELKLTFDSSMDAEVTWLQNMLFRSNQL